jgi:hypothetical protein
VGAVITLEERRNSCPLHLIFSPSDHLSLITDPTQLNCTREEASAFKCIFKHLPATFLKMELDRRNRCADNGVRYLPPKIFDSVDATFDRVKKLNRAIEAAQKQKRRLAMTPQERREVSAKRAESRRHKLSRETEEDRKQRLKCNASYIKGHRERKFEADCKKRYMKYRRREEEDTISVVRARRREYRDMIKSRWLELNANGYPQDNVPDPYSFGDVVLQCHARRARREKGHSRMDSYNKTLRACLKCKERKVKKTSYKNGYVLCYDCEYGKTRNYKRK